jgi:hypothetical protein
MYHTRIQPAHLVPTAWWSGISDWHIPASDRIERDRVGLTTGAQ